jgi:hypothetical protein
LATSRRTSAHAALTQGFHVAFEAGSALLAIAALLAAVGVAARTGIADTGV